MAFEVKAVIPTNDANVLYQLDPPYVSMIPVTLGGQKHTLKHTKGDMLAGKLLPKLCEDREHMTTRELSVRLAH